METREKALIYNTLSTMQLYCNIITDCRRHELVTRKYYFFND